VPATIEIVSATRGAEEEFWNRSALGVSLQRLKGDERIVSRIALGNRRGLPEIYNMRIAACEEEAIVFVHDDVWLEDMFIADRVLDGLKQYDVIGVAGNRRRVPRQATWSHALPKELLNASSVWDKGNLSGAVAHGAYPFGGISVFGPAPADCELLDGMFIAARTAALRERAVRFDPRFQFHYYDLDFCRSARQAGLRLGTWPIGVTHQSAAHFAGPAWDEGYRLYLEKWRD
jgi:GT2 family glycosyltransferase